MSVSRRGFFASLLVTPVMGEITFAPFQQEKEYEEDTYRVISLVFSPTYAAKENQFLKLVLENIDGVKIRVNIPLNGLFFRIIEETLWLRDFHPLTNNIVSETDLVSTPGIRII